ncbi:SNF2 family N-terminal domain-containing protein [Hypoxylon cercidicola]|nr:SNF2 family N-terminal domain-containing protein [Hypoxylon cercidicola]
MNQTNLNFLKRPWQFEDHNGALNPGSSYASPMSLDQVSWNYWSSNHTNRMDLQNLVETVDQNEHHLSSFIPMIDDHGGTSGDNSLVMPPAVETLHNTCFGTIPDVYTRLRSQPQDISNEITQSFHVCSDGAYYGLSLRPSETPFSVFGRKTCEELQQLLSLWHLRLEAYAHTKDLRTIKTMRHQEKSSSITVDINVYGAREDAREVGKKLASFGITLQQPLFGLAGTTYYNPHFLHTQELFGHYVAETPLLRLGAETQTTTSREHSHPEVPRPQLDPDTEVRSILNSLSHHTVLHKRTEVHGLKTTLKDHQMEAIDFILRRETDLLPPELALWQEVELDSGDLVYQHIISGTRREKPAEAKGGILADEMGLGKTMVALSIIAASLSRASEFASGNLRPDGEQNIRQCSKATLVIVPSSLVIDIWVDEIRKHIYPGYLSYYKYHGPRREDDANNLFNCNIVLTTYATVAMEMSNGRNMLRNVEWFRIVLDEAHEIRNRTTKQFQVVANLVAQYRWCLTGTPIQNSLDDLGALVTFAKVPLLENPATFRRFIVNQSNSGTRERFRNLRILLGSICLRRTKDIVGLSDPIEQTRRLEFTPHEMEEYNNLLIRCRTRIDMSVSGDQKGLNSAMLQSLLRLRLFCNHRHVKHASWPSSVDTDEIITYLHQTGQAACAYCSRAIYSINNNPGTDGGSILPCDSHLACRDCEIQFKHLPCPLCSSDTNYTGIKDLVQTLDPKAAGSGDPHQKYEYPSKLIAFLGDIQQHNSCKSIVFSSWKKTLDLVGELLSYKGLKYYCIHGALPLSERLRILHGFKSQAGANILLMTLGTGAVGLNLAVATRIYLLEPQWNPSVEKQAFGRATRLGQTKQVTIVRYIMKDTVEDENVRSRQRNKLQLASSGFEQQSRVHQSDRIDALRMYFGLPESTSRVNRSR